MTLSIYGNESKFEFYVDDDGSITIVHEVLEMGISHTVYVNKEQFNQLVNFINDSMFIANQITLKK